MVNRLLIILLLAAAPALGQTVFRFDSNVSDLNPERDAFTATTGVIRITADINNGAGILDLSTAALPITLLVTHRTDGWTSPIVSAIDTVPTNGIIRWQFTLNPGEYELYSELVFPDTTFPAFWRYLSMVPQADPSAVINIESNAVQVSADVNITNIISSTLIINVEGNAVAEIVQP
jgi:hypothetical protein